MDGVFEAMQDALAGGGFGGADRVRHVFSQERPARTGRHPRTGEGIEIAASTGPSFKVGKTLRDAVR